MYEAVTPQKAVEVVKSHDRVFVHSVAAAPDVLLDALVERAPELRNVEMVHLHIEGKAPHTAPELRDSFKTNNLFVGGNSRNTLLEGNGSYVPVFLSEVPLMFRRGIMPLDVALIQVSPPDKHGYCSLGVSVDASKAAIDSAKHVIAQVNSRMPRTHGDGLVHISKLDSFVEVDYPIHEMPAHEPNDVEMRIGQHVASLVEDKSCLQMGIGAIPNAALKAMENHRDLGIHTEMFSDGILDLVERGVITGKAKHRDTGKIVGGFAMGTRRLYDFIDDNPEVNMLDIQYVNNVGKIKRNKNTVAINSAIEVDFTGQVCADSIGNRIYSGVGGQMDFMRGASLSEGGKPIIALPSQTNKGVSRISPFPKKAAGVVTTRAHAHYIITEYGVANLYGKNIHQRINAMIDIAHPNHREELLKEAFELYNYKQNIFGGSF